MFLFTSNPIEEIRITPPKHIVPSTIVVGRVPSASFRLIGIQTSIALVATPILDAFTARCGACSSSRFLFRRYLFACRCCLWLTIACTTNSSPHPLLRNKHPAANPALITFRGLWGIVIFAKLTRTNCISATRICAVSRYPVNCRFCLSAPTTELKLCFPLLRKSLRLEGD